jgi:hypothetical protein
MMKIYVDVICNVTYLLALIFENSPAINGALAEVPLRLYIYLYIYEYIYVYIFMSTFMVYVYVFKRICMFINVCICKFFRLLIYI